MRSKMEACAECSRSCTLLHMNKLDPNPIVSSFFKIMYFEQFSEVLFVPPQFTKTVTGLEGKSTYLEDATGQKWQVKLSYVDGRLAIKQGWHEFLVDHGIERGDIVVFHYFKGSHFVVQIFGTSGCEKPMIFNGKDCQNKRGKRARVSFSENHCESTHRGSLAKERLGSYMDSAPEDVHVVRREDGINNVPKSTENGANVCTNSVPGDVHVVRRKDDINNVPKSTENNGANLCMNSAPVDFHVVKRKYDDVNNVPKSTENNGANLCMNSVPDDVHVVKRKYDVNNVPESTENNGANVCMSSVPDDVDVVMRKDDVNNVPESTENNGANVETANKEPSVVPTADFLLVSCSMTNRNASFSGEDGRKDSLLDLSIFEMPGKKPVAVNASLKTSQAEVASLDVVECEMAEDTYEADWPMEESASLPNNVDSQANTMKTIPVPHKPEFSTPAAYCQNPDCGRMKAEPKSGTSVCHNAVADEYSQKREILSTTEDQKVKTNDVGRPSTSKIDEKVRRGKAVIPEVVDLCDSDSSPELDFKMTCSVKHSSESYLELPSPLLVKDCKQENAASSEKKKLIFLRDPARRLWPVVYHQRKGLQALAYGWKEFSQTNHIEPGDRCAFVLENANKNIFQVKISFHGPPNQTKASVRYPGIAVKKPRAP